MDDGPVVGTLTTGWTSTWVPTQMMLTRIQNEPDEAIRLELEAALHQWQANDCLRRSAALFAQRHDHYPSPSLEGNP